MMQYSRSKKKFHLAPSFLTFLSLVGCLHRFEPVLRKSRVVGVHDRGSCYCRWQKLKDTRRDQHPNSPSRSTSPVTYLSSIPRLLKAPFPPKSILGWGASPWNTRCKPSAYCQWTLPPSLHFFFGIYEDIHSSSPSSSSILLHESLFLCPTQKDWTCSRSCCSHLIPHLTLHALTQWVHPVWGFRW